MPTIVETVSATLALVTSPLVLEAQLSEVGDDHEAVTHCEIPMLSDGVVSDTPKFKPLTLNVAPLVAAKFEGESAVTTDESKENAEINVPTSDVMVTRDVTEGPDPPGTGIQTIEVVVEYTTDAQAFDPILVDAVASVTAKLVPRTVKPILPGLYVGMLVGFNVEMAGLSYEKTSSAVLISDETENETEMS